MTDSGPLVPCQRCQASCPREAARRLNPLFGALSILFGIGGGLGRTVQGMREATGGYCPRCWRYLNACYLFVLGLVALVGAAALWERVAGRG